MQTDFLSVRLPDEVFIQAPRMQVFFLPVFLARIFFCTSKACVCRPNFSRKTRDIPVLTLKGRKRGFLDIELESDDGALLILHTESIF